MISKSEIAKILAENNIELWENLGQNFLVSEYMMKKILNSCKLSKKDIVLEIGAGMGNLTEHLVRRCKKVIAVEKDRRLTKILKQRVDDERLEVITEDIRGLKMANLDIDRKIKVVGNLPYCISSDLLNYLIENKDYIRSLYCSLQKEYADRLLAEPGSKEYGRITILMSYYTEIARLFEIPSKYFYPSPEVDSSFLHIYFRSKPSVEVKEEDFFFKLIKVGFQNRRKQFINCLDNWHEMKFTKGELRSIIKELDINPNIRAEKLSIEDFASYSNALLEKR